MKKPSTKEVSDLYNAILQLNSLDECRRFFRDLLTEYEIKEFVERWKAAQMLADGIPYTQIETETGLSTRTIARVGRWLKKGKGGYSMMLKRTTKL
jgi:TrpR-related protein YerC/YecD